jgi:hypothetical protein
VGAISLWFVTRSIGGSGSHLIDLASLNQTITYVPRGLSNVLFAPYPWAVRRVIDLPTIPEMLAWYTILAAAAWTVARHRRRLGPASATLLAFAGTALVVYVLTEGNVGTVFRHRAMTVTPFLTVLAAPTLLKLWAAIARRRLIPD